MKSTRKFIIAVLIILVLIQFIPRSLPVNKAPSENDLIRSEVAKGETAQILKTSCYDCHSNTVNYPWYSYIAPVSWLISHDINEGKEHLNFSEWNSMTQNRKECSLSEIKEMIEKDEMPIPLYTLIHTKAKLSKEQKELIIKWTEDLSVQQN